MYTCQKCGSITNPGDKEIKEVIYREKKYLYNKSIEKVSPAEKERGFVNMERIGRKKIVTLESVGFEAEKELKICKDCVND